MTTRREFFKKGILAGAGLALLNTSLGSEAEQAAEPSFSLPPLPYGYDALEPFIDKRTMEIHHTGHHQAYVNNLNKALADIKTNKPSLEDICRSISKYTVAVRNNAGGHYNHSMFWKSLQPNAGSVLSPEAVNEPTGKLKDAILSSFGTFEDFKTKFSEKAMGTFGSGWAWLVISKNGKLEVGSTPNQDNPLMDSSPFRGYPILGLDVWEHAYYLKYQNKRADYVAAWWKLVNWEETASRFGR